MRRLCWLLAAALALGWSAPTPAADPPKADAETIAKLIKQLGSDDFEAREKATKELEVIGTPALEALREAAKSGDPEVKLRATSILQTVEKLAVTEKLLAPTKVKLTFKDTPLADAVAEFNKKSGYTILVHDPEKKLKDRKVTLDTGEVTFWEAFDKFCEKAGLAEATMQDLMKAVTVPPPGGGPGGVLPPPPPIKVPKDIKANPATPVKEKKEQPAPKKDDDKADAPPAAAPLPAPQAPPAPPAGKAVVAGRRVAPVIAPFGFDPGAITVVDAKPKSVPTCYSGAVRIRALKDAPDPGLGLPIPAPPPGGGPQAKDDTHTVWLEVRAEPKMQVQLLQSVAFTKATDDRDQKLEKFTPPAPPVPGGLPGGPVPPGGAAGRLGIAIGYGGFGGGMPGFGGTHTIPVRLKKGEKEAKALKEFVGTITAMVMAPAEPVITAEKITKAAGETFKGKDGGQIKVIEVKEEDGKITLKFEMEMPQNVPGGLGVPVTPVPVAPPPLPPAPAKPVGGGFGLQVGGGGPPAPPGAGPGFPAVRGFFPAQGITLVDDKGKTIPQTGGGPPTFKGAPGAAPRIEFTQEYKLEKDQKPAKLIYSVSKMVTLDIPFSFKDVPLK
jgi:hypothetical protein